MGLLFSMFRKVRNRCTYVHESPYCVWYKENALSPESCVQQGDIGITGQGRLHEVSPWVLPLSFHPSQEIKKLTDYRQRNVFQEKTFIGYLLILSFITYLIGALIFYIYYSPQSWLEYGLYSIPLVLFPIV